MFNAPMEAREELKKVAAFIQSIKDEIGKPKFEYGIMTSTTTCSTSSRQPATTSSRLPGYR